MLGFRELEHSTLYAGVGVQLVDEFASVPAQDLVVPPLGATRVELDLDDAGTWRPVARTAVHTPGGVAWFPYLERHADARDRAPRSYRIRVWAQLYTPRYAYDADGVIVQVAPYDDEHAPAFTPGLPVKVALVPNAAYPYPDAVPILRGGIVDTSGAPVTLALVSWIDAALQTDAVLTDADGEFSLPLRRAPRDTPIVVHAERPPPPAGGRSGDVIVRIPQDLSTFHTIQIS